MKKFLVVFLFLLSVHSFASDSVVNCKSNKVYPFSKENCDLCPNRFFKHSHSNVGYCFPKEFTCPEGQIVKMGWRHTYFHHTNSDQKDEKKELKRDPFELSTASYEHMFECVPCSEKNSIIYKEFDWPAEIESFVNCSVCPNRERTFLKRFVEDQEKPDEFKMCSLKKCPDGFCFDKFHNCIDESLDACIQNNVKNEILLESKSVGCLNSKYNGALRDSNDEIFYTIKCGKLYDKKGDLTGKIDVNGKMYDLNDKYIGHVDENDNVYGTDGNLIGKWTVEGFSSSTCVNAKYNGKVYDSNGELLYTTKCGRVYDKKGNLIGYIDENGNMINLDGTIFGNIAENSDVYDADKKKVGKWYFKETDSK